MGQTVIQALKDGQLFSDNIEYRFVKLPVNAITVAAGIVAEVGTPFTGLLVDKDEVSLMLAEDDYQAFKKRLVDSAVSKATYRLITLDVELEPTLVGFMATISNALAEAEISILPFAAYSRDHLFVTSEDHARALATLENLKASQE